MSALPGDGELEALCLLDGLDDALDLLADELELLDRGDSLDRKSVV